MPFAVDHIREVLTLNSTDRAELDELGWNERFASAFDDLDDKELQPGRLAADYSTQFLVQLAGAAPLATLGHALREARLVAVGDWVAVRKTAQATEIRALLPRQSAITREAPGAETAQQVIAANVDLVFIATSADTDFNLRRIERLLTVAYQSGAAPVIVLTKVDLGNPDPFEAELQTIATGVPVVAVSGLTGAGIEAVRQHLSRGKTGVLVGSSGVGKSTLINRLVGEDMLRTADVHRSGQGRHTTSHRQLLKVPSGGLIIDTPGLREIQLCAGRSDSGTLRRLIRIRVQVVFRPRIESTRTSEGARCDQTSAWRPRQRCSPARASASVAARAISISGMVLRRRPVGPTVLPGAGAGACPLAAAGRSSRRRLESRTRARPPAFFAKCR